jgi:hypothetical protein
MKTIKTEKQLQGQKKQLQKRQHELEALIRANWIELKHQLKPKNVAGEIFSQAFSNKSEDESSTLAENLSKIAAAFTKMAVEKAEERFSDWLKKKN